MTASTIAITLLGLVLYLDAAAIYYAVKTEMYTNKQLVAQACIVFLVPIVGAVTVLSFSISQLSLETVRTSENKISTRFFSLLFLSFIIPISIGQTGSFEPGSNTGDSVDTSNH